MGYMSKYEPTMVLQSRFTLGARNIINKSYEMMKGKPFILVRYDVDFMVLPVKYLDEIRLMKESKLSSRSAQVGNLEPKYTGVEFLIHSNLHVKVLREKLIPELWKFVDMARVEMVHGWDLDVPEVNDWEAVNIEYVMRMLVARMTAKIFMGHPVCRDPEWLKISIDFSIDMFKTTFGLKMFPGWMYPVAIYLLPQRWRAQRQLKKSQEFVAMLTDKHLQAQKLGHEEEDTLLNWQIDHALPSEREIPEMAARQCVLTLASIHTTAMTVSNIIYDLCANPEYFEPMVEELDEVFARLGGPNKKWGEGNSSREWVAGLQKIDSLFVESQRQNPVILLNPQRLAKETVVFKDGTTIPEGTRLAFPMYDHHMDSSVHPEADKFDPLRSYRKRHQSPDQMHLFQAGQTSPNNLSFGYGNQACTGRQFAVAEIKLILGRLLHDYEFKLPDGKERPKIQYINENVFTDQSATVMMRKRRRAGEK
ncbi:unnamed protein product [Discula destructiva]